MLSQLASRVPAGKCLPRSTVLDGEIVIADDEGRAEFGALAC
jgi:ATP-dependent DNA ligase